MLLHERLEFCETTRKSSVVRERRSFSAPLTSASSQSSLLARGDLEREFGPHRLSEADEDTTFTYSIEFEPPGGKLGDVAAKPVEAE
jgi:hypothetical protein